MIFISHCSKVINDVVVFILSLPNFFLQYTVLKNVPKELLRHFPLVLKEYSSTVKNRLNECNYVYLRVVVEGVQ